MSLSAFHVTSLGPERPHEAWGLLEAINLAQGTLGTLSAMALGSFVLGLDVVATFRRRTR